MTHFPRETRENGMRKIEHLLAVNPSDTCSHTLSPSRLWCADQPRICIREMQPRSTISNDETKRYPARNSNQLAGFRSTCFYAARREKRGPTRHPGLSSVGERTRRRKVNPLHFDDHLGWATQSLKRKKVRDERKTTFYRFVDIRPRGSLHRSLRFYLSTSLECFFFFFAIMMLLFYAFFYVAKLFEKDPTMIQSV